VYLAQVMPTPPNFSESLRPVLSTFHGVLALLPMVGMYLMLSNKIPVADQA